MKANKSENGWFYSIMVVFFIMLLKRQKLKNCKGNYKTSIRGEPHKIKFFLVKRLVNLRYKEGNNISEHLSEFQDVVN